MMFSLHHHRHTWHLNNFYAQYLIYIHTEEISYSDTLLWKGAWLSSPYWQ